MRKSPKFSPEVVKRAVRMVYETKNPYPSQWAAIVSIAGKIGATPETLRRWIRQGERDSGLREGLTTAEQQRIKALEREVKELRRANEILKLASAFFAQAELDRVSSREGFHRHALRDAWGRADLQGAAGRPVGLSAASGTVPKPGIAPAARPARYGAVASDGFQ